MRLRATIALAALVGAAAGCGGGSSAPGPGDATVSDVGAQHIHGLGINPADRSLMIATHSGLFAAGPDQKAAKRIGDSRQDTMGFTVIGPDRFLGSGHPDARDDLPPLLGLIRSDDAGLTWEPISLLGEADFHMLRASGQDVYGFDATQARLLVSADSGRSWERRTPPAPVIDLAVKPGDAGQVVASTEAGIFGSTDGARTWRPIARRQAGLLAWTSAGLTLVDGSGDVFRATDAGRQFERIGEIGGQPAALATDGDDLYIALHTNEVKVSSDRGRTWSLRVTA